MSNPWITLILAGLLEIGWATTLKATDGFTRFWPSLATLVLLAGSMWLLALSARSLPIGTAYAVWVGIGATGTALLGIVLYGEPASALRIGFMTLLLLSIVGLKFTA